MKNVAVRWIPKVLLDPKNLVRGEVWYDSMPRSGRTLRDQQWQEKL